MDSQDGPVQQSFLMLRGDLRVDASKYGALTCVSHKPLHVLECSSLRLCSFMTSSPKREGGDSQHFLVVNRRPDSCKSHPVWGLGVLEAEFSTPRPLAWKALTMI